MLGYVLKTFKMFSVFQRQLSRTLIRTVINNKSTKTFSNVCRPHNLPLVSCISAPCNYETIRHKSKKGEKKPPSSVSETEEKNTWDDEVVDKNTKIMQISAKSTRVDGILKSALGIARNKIETLFYESKIRVNGQKLLKKSDIAQEGDEIDVVKGVSVNNPNFLTVARVEILEIKERGENVSIKVRRCKTLTIDKYEDEVNSQKSS